MKAASKKSELGIVSNGVRKIVQVGNAVLRHTAEKIPISDIRSSKIRKLVADMRTLLAKEKYGVALAAPQVGESVQLFIVSGRRLAEADSGHAKPGKALAQGKRMASDETDDAKDKQEESEKEQFPDFVYINPQLLKISRKQEKKHEGCLSIRGKWGEVRRAEKATIRAYDEKGLPFTRGASGFLAHIFQHEMDHLNGILYTDKAVKIYDDHEVQGHKHS